MSHGPLGGLPGACWWGWREEVAFSEVRCSAKWICWQIAQSAGVGPGVGAKDRVIQVGQTALGPAVTCREDKVLALNHVGELGTGKGNPLVVASNCFFKILPCHVNQRRQRWQLRGESAWLLGWHLNPLHLKCLVIEVIWYCVPQGCLEVRTCWRGIVAGDR